MNYLNNANSKSCSDEYNSSIYGKTSLIKKINKLDKGMKANFLRISILNTIECNAIFFLLKKMAAY